ncbi:MAG TPA: DUF1566 domain-containing protein [Candidatus Binatia bacterium]|jgi:hypothetical protein
MVTWSLRSWTAALTLLAACHGGSDPSVVKGDTRFVPVVDGAVRDRTTGLQWTSRDHERALAWNDAERHCRGLALGGVQSWRLPEIDELGALYDAAVAAPCGSRTCHLDPAISLGDPYVWSATAPAEGARYYFDFAFGNRFSPGIPPTLVRRVLCVRQAG